MGSEIVWAQRAGTVTRVQRPRIGRVLEHDGLVTSVWEFVPASRRQGPQDLPSLGAALRELHDGVRLDSSELAAIDQLATARARLLALQTSRPLVAAQLAPLLDRAQGVLAAQPAAGLVACHGDAHDGNIVVGPAGLTLLDFDSAGVGPRSLDLASGVYVCRYRYAGDRVVLEGLLAGYGDHPQVDAGALWSLAWVRRVRAACTQAQLGADVSWRIAELESTRPH
jgi:Ser/Thr protein kinase RdoA (MazF antagonist)